MLREGRERSRAMLCMALNDNGGGRTVRFRPAYDWRQGLLSGWQPTSSPWDGPHALSLEWLSTLSSPWDGCPTSPSPCSRASPAQLASCGAVPLHLTSHRAPRLAPHTLSVRVLCLPHFDQVPHRKT
eukprot:358747-Chlamydomonas_euryale.AAC.3